MPTENTPAPASPAAQTQAPAVPAVVVPDTYPQTTPEEWFEDLEPDEPAPAKAAVPAPAAAVPAVPPPPPAPAKHSHPRWVERAAIKMGMADADIEGTPTDELQQRLLQTSERQADEARALALRADRRDGEKPAAGGRPTVEPPPEDTYAKFALDPEQGWDEGFTKTWNSVVEHLKAQDLKIAHLTGTASQFQAKEAATVHGQIEAFFGKHAHVYLPGGKRDDFRCEAVMNALNGFLRNKTATTLVADLERVHAGLFGAIPEPSAASPPPPPAADPVREGIKDAYLNGGLNRPTQRNQTPLPKGRAAAIAASDAYLRDHTLNGVEHTDDAEDTLP